MTDCLKRLAGRAPLRIDRAYEEMIYGFAADAIEQLARGNREPGRTLLVNLGLMRDRRPQRPRPTWTPRRRYEADAAENEVPW